MSNKREELIKKALLEQLSGIGKGVNLYTSDDILLAADISETEMKEFHGKIKKEIERLAFKKID